MDELTPSIQEGTIIKLSSSKRLMSGFLESFGFPSYQDSL
jgi:hypothetical protein